MRYLSLFSGIEACSVAWAPLGWECVAVAEIEPWPSRVLAHHYPDVPNLGDVTKVTEEQIAMLGRIDVVVFGSPCQDLSVAGKRKGLDGARSGLFFTAMRIVGWARQWCDCRFALWENVPGAFSSNKGRDFAAVVDAMAGLEGTGVPPKGWGTEGCALGSEAMVEWSTLDAQWFGVAQRRRRVFALADFGDWRNRPPILLEPESVRGDTAPSREAGEDVAGTLASRTRGGGFPGSDEACGGYVRPVLSASTGDVSHCLNAGGMGRIDYETETMIACTYAVRTAQTGDPCHPLAAGAHCLNAGGETMVVCVPEVAGTMKACKESGGWSNSADHAAAGYMIPVLTFNSNAQPDEMKFDEHVSAPLTCSQYSAVAVRDVSPTLTGNYGKQVDNSDTALGPNVVLQRDAVAVSLRGREGGGTAELGGDVQNCLRASGGGGDKLHVLTAMRVRRLTPRECEKLQGFSPNYTAVPDARGKPSADGPRYKALGNSMAVPVMRWIGQSIDYAMLWSTP